MTFKKILPLGLALASVTLVLVTFWQNQDTTNPLELLVSLILLVSLLGMLDSPELGAIVFGLVNLELLGYYLLLGVALISPRELVLFFLAGMAIVLVQKIKLGAESRAVHNENRLKYLVHQSPYPIIALNKAGELVFASQGLQNIIGFNHDYLKGKKLEDKIHPEDLSKYLRHQRKLLDSDGEIMVIECRVLTNNQSWRWLKLTGINSLSVSGVEAMVSFVEDITRQKELYIQHRDSLAREQKARSEAEQAVRIRDEFISIASHELKTPLTTIMLHLRRTVRKIMTQSIADFSGEQVVQGLEVAEKQSQHLSRMIQDLLDLSVIAKGKIEIETMPGELGEMIRKVVLGFEEQVVREGSQIRLDLDEPVTGYWDVIRIEQVLVNLVSNALKFGRGKPVEISLKHDPGTATVEVRDYGEGIDLAKQSRIFDLFNHKYRDGQKGLGVGLFVARQIARSHQGELAVTSEPGQGSTFRLTLPTNLFEGKLSEVLNNQVEGQIEAGSPVEVKADEGGVAWF